MRLLKAILRNYRVHRHLEVLFDPSRNLIGGPNEVGKSTLVEALHRVLFQKAKGQSEVHRLMVPLWGGNPEVELEFEAAGSIYKVAKRFGASGTTVLTSATGRHLTGDHAESELSSLLGVDSFASSKSTSVQWSHLWVFQGVAGANPIEFVSQQRERLIPRLEELGAAAVLQSQNDSRLSSEFATQVSEWFTPTGRCKQGSSLDRAAKVSEEADASFANMSNRVRELESSTRQLDQAVSELLRLETEEIELTQEADSLQKISSQLQVLQADLKGIDSKLAQLNTQYQTLKRHNKAILDLREEIGSLGQRALQAADDKLVVEQQSSELEALVSRLEDELQGVIQAIGQNRNEEKLLETWKKIREVDVEAQDLRELSETVSKHSADLRQLQSALALLPLIDKSEWLKLKSLQGDLEKKESLLKATAATLEVQSADTRVQLDGRDIHPNIVCEITEDAELLIGESTRIRVSPGGGSSLGKVRAEAKKATDDFHDYLRFLQVPDVEAAERAWEDRTQLSGKIKRLQEQLREIDIGDVEGKLNALAPKKQALEAKLQALRSSMTSIPTPIDLEEMEGTQRDLIENLRELQQLEKDLRERIKAEKDALRNLSASVSAKGTRRTELDTELRIKRTQLERELAEYGEDDVRKRALDELRQQIQELSESRNLKNDEILRLAPHDIESDLTRVGRALKIIEKSKISYTSQKSVATYALKSEGLEDPHSNLANAKVRKELAKQHFSQISKKAEAVKLLNKLFAEEQQALSDQFTIPLAEKVTEYLRCIFGSAVSARIEMQDNKFSGLIFSRNSRDAQACKFDVLSGGTREQVASAVRLAMAEILAANHDGCLPIVFDDAFAYSDPSRVRALQRMLDLGATRGLQLIVATCNPSDYATLGATSIPISANDTPPSVAEAIAEPLPVQPKDPVPVSVTASNDWEMVEPQVSALASRGMNLPEELTTHASDAFQLKQEEPAVLPAVSDSSPASGFGLPPIMVGGERSRQEVDLDSDDMAILDYLKEKGGSAARSVSRYELNWQSDRFEAVLRKLMQAGLIRRDRTGLRLILNR